MLLPIGNTNESICRWIIDHTDFGLIVTDSNLVITYVNNWIEDSSGRQKSELTGKHIFDCFPEIKERKLDQYLANALEGASVILSARFHKYFLRFPTHLPTSDRFMKQTVKIASVYEKTTLSGLFITIQDVTERTNNEELLQKKNEDLVRLNSTKDKFFNIIAHDLRSPFTALIGFTEILKDDNSLSTEQRQNIIRMLHSTVKNQYYFLENLLKWAQMQTGKYRLTYSKLFLEEIINHILDIILPMSEAKGISVTTQITPELGMFSDPNAITTILYNLTVNAIKFTPDGGKVEITASKEDGITTIAVKDNGVGIEEERIGKLFRIDESNSTLGTKNEKGSGLGLILVKDLVEYMSGKVWIESTRGKGSSFYVLIPDHEEDVTPRHEKDL